MKPLFECELLEKKTVNKVKKYKSIPLDKYIILCEKEAIIDFLHDKIPFGSVPVRISSGRYKGDYTVKAKYVDFMELDIGLLDKCYEDSNNQEKIMNYMENLYLKANCDFAYASWYTLFDEDDIDTRYHKIDSYLKHINWKNYSIMIKFKIYEVFRKTVLNEYMANIEIVLREIKQKK
jgi:hypothetical protein